MNVVPAKAGIQKGLRLLDFSLVEVTDFIIIRGLLKSESVALLVSIRTDTDRFRLFFRIKVPLLKLLVETCPAAPRVTTPPQLNSNPVNDANFVFPI